MQRVAIECNTKNVRASFLVIAGSLAIADTFVHRSYDPRCDRRTLSLAMKPQHAQPRSQSSSAKIDVTSPVNLIGRH